VQIPGLRNVLHESEWVLVHAVRVNEVLTQSLAPTLRDIEASGFDCPLVEDKSWTDDPDVASARLWSPTGSCMGIQVRLTAPEAERVATVADQVQESVSGIVITSAAHATFTRGHRGRFVVHTTGASSFGYTRLGALPNGVTLSRSGVLAGTPRKVGTYRITLLAVAGSKSTSQSFVLTVRS
jgi:hypothetical protein